MARLILPGTKLLHFQVIWLLPKSEYYLCHRVLCGYHGMLKLSWTSFSDTSNLFHCTYSYYHHSKQFTLSDKYVSMSHSVYLWYKYIYICLWNITKLTERLHTDIQIQCNTVRCRYNAVNFLKNIHKRYPIACLLGWDMGRFLWIHHLVDNLPDFLQSFMQYLIISDCVITALDCIPQMHTEQWNVVLLLLTETYWWLSAKLQNCKWGYCSLALNHWYIWSVSLQQSHKQCCHCLLFQPACHASPISGNHVWHECVVLIDSHHINQSSLIEKSQPIWVQHVSCNTSWLLKLYKCI